MAGPVKWNIAQRGTLRSPMPDANKLTPASSEDLAAALAFALRFEGRKRVHNADESMSEIVAKRLVRHLELAGFVVLKKPPIGGGAALGRGARARIRGPINSTIIVHRRAQFPYLEPPAAWSFAASRFARRTEISLSSMWRKFGRSVLARSSR